MRNQYSYCMKFFDYKIMSSSFCLSTRLSMSTGVFSNLCTTFNYFLNTSHFLLGWSQVEQACWCHLAQHWSGFHRWWDEDGAIGAWEEQGCVWSQGWCHRSCWRYLSTSSLHTHWSLTWQLWICIFWEHRSTHAQTNHENENTVWCTLAKWKQNNASKLALLRRYGVCCSGVFVIECQKNTLQL